MAKTDKNGIIGATTGLAKSMKHRIFEPLKRRWKLSLGIGVGVLAVAGVVTAVAMNGAPDSRVLDAMNGLNPSLPELQKMVSKDPKNARLQLALGHAYFDHGQFSSAVVRYDTALVLDKSLASQRIADNLVTRYGTKDHAAAYATIVKFHLTDAEDGLRKLVPDKRNVVRTGAVATLDKLGKATKEDWHTMWLLDLKDEDCEVRRNAVERLGEFGDKTALAALKAADKKDEDGTAWYQFSCLGDRPEEAVEKISARK
jgi:hypothetical protein